MSEQINNSYSIESIERDVKLPEKMLDIKKLEDSYLDYYVKTTLYNDKYRFNKSEEITDTIHQMSDYINTYSDNELYDIAKKIIPREKIIKEMLTYDFMNYIPSTKIENIDECTKFSINSFNKYQYIVGGENIEDPEWILLHNSNHRFKVKSHQKILYNSIEKKYCNDELISFLDNIIDYIKRHTDTTKIGVKYIITEDEKHNICWIIVIFSDKNIA
jgi:hypothetical protein